MTTQKIFMVKEIDDFTNVYMHLLLYNVR